MKYGEKFDIAVKLMQQEQFEQAAAQWQIVVNNFDDNGVALSNMCFCLLKLERYIDIVRVYTQSANIQRKLDKFNLQFMNVALSKCNVEFADETVKIKDIRQGYVLEDTEEKDFLKRMAKAPLTKFFDVGANVANWTKCVKELFDNSEIHAFEIVPATFEIYQKNAAGLDNITANQIGLSDKEGEVKVYINSLSNEVSSTVNYWDVKEFEMCKVTTGDQYMQEKGIDKIDFLKIDVEGSDFLTVKGFENALKNNKIRALQFEYGQANIISHHLLHDFYRYLEQFGYTIGPMVAGGKVNFKTYEYTDENFRGPNYVACKKDDIELMALLS